MSEAASAQPPPPQADQVEDLRDWHNVADVVQNSILVLEQQQGVHADAISHLAKQVKKTKDMHKKCCHPSTSAASSQPPPDRVLFNNQENEAPAPLVAPPTVFIERRVHSVESSIKQFQMQLSSLAAMNQQQQHHLQQHAQTTITVDESQVRGIVNSVIAERAIEQRQRHFEATTAVLCAMLDDDDTGIRVAQVHVPVAEEARTQIRSHISAIVQRAVARHMEGESESLLGFVDRSTETSQRLFEEMERMRQKQSQLEEKLTGQHATIQSLQQGKGSDEQQHQEQMQRIELKHQKEMQQLRSHIATVESVTEATHEKMLQQNTKLTQQIRQLQEQQQEKKEKKEKKEQDDDDGTNNRRSTPTTGRRRSDSLNESNHRITELQQTVATLKKRVGDVESVPAALEADRSRVDQLRGEVTVLRSVAEEADRTARKVANAPPQPNNNSNNNNNNVVTPAQLRGQLEQQAEQAAQQIKAATKDLRCVQQEHSASLDNLLRLHETTHEIATSTRSKLSSFADVASDDARRLRDAFGQHQTEVQTKLAQFGAFSHGLQHPPAAMAASPQTTVASSSPIMTPTRAAAEPVSINIQNAPSERLQSSVSELEATTRSLAARVERQDAEVSQCRNLVAVAQAIAAETKQQLSTTNEEVGVLKQKVEKSSVQDEAASPLRRALEEQQQQTQRLAQQMSDERDKQRKTDADAALLAAAAAHTATVAEELEKRVVQSQREAADALSRQLSGELAGHKQELEQQRREEAHKLSLDREQQQRLEQERLSTQQREAEAEQQRAAELRKKEKKRRAATRKQERKQERLRKQQQRFFLFGEGAGESAGDTTATSDDTAMETSSSSSSSSFSSSSSSSSSGGGGDRNKRKNHHRHHSRRHRKHNSRAASHQQKQQPFLPSLLNSHNLRLDEVEEAVTKLLSWSQQVEERNEAASTGVVEIEEASVRREQRMQSEMLTRTEEVQEMFHSAITALAERMQTVENVVGNGNGGTFASVVSMLPTHFGGVTCSSTTTAASMVETAASHQHVAYQLSQLQAAHSSLSQVVQQLQQQQTSSRSQNANFADASMSSAAGGAAAASTSTPLLSSPLFAPQPATNNQSAPAAAPAAPSLDTTSIRSIAAKIAADPVARFELQSGIVNAESIAAAVLTSSSSSSSSSPLATTMQLQQLEKRSKDNAEAQLERIQGIEERLNEEMDALEEKVKKVRKQQQETAAAAPSGCCGSNCLKSRELADEIQVSRGRLDTETASLRSAVAKLRDDVTVVAQQQKIQQQVSNQSGGGDSNNDNNNNSAAASAAAVAAEILASQQRQTQQLQELDQQQQAKLDKFEGEMKQQLRDAAEKQQQQLSNSSEELQRLQVRLTARVDDFERDLSRVRDTLRADIADVEKQGREAGHAVRQQLQQTGFVTAESLRSQLQQQEQQLVQRLQAEVIEPCVRRVEQVSKEAEQGRESQESFSKYVSQQVEQINGTLQEVRLSYGVGKSGSGAGGGGGGGGAALGEIGRDQIINAVERRCAAVEDHVVEETRALASDISSLRGRFDKLCVEFVDSVSEMKQHVLEHESLIAPMLIKRAPPPSSPVSPNTSQQQQQQLHDENSNPAESSVPQNAGVTDSVLSARTPTPNKQQQQKLPTGAFTAMNRQQQREQQQQSGNNSSSFINFLPANPSREEGMLQQLHDAIAADVQGHCDRLLMQQLSRKANADSVVQRTEVRTMVVDICNGIVAPMLTGPLRREVDALWKEMERVSLDFDRLLGIQDAVDTAQQQQQQQQATTARRTTTTTTHQKRTTSTSSSRRKPTVSPPADDDDDASSRPGDDSDDVLGNPPAMSSVEDVEEIYGDDDVMGGGSGSVDRLGLGSNDGSIDRPPLAPPTRHISLRDLGQK